MARNQRAYLHRPRWSSRRRARRPAAPAPWEGTQIVDIARNVRVDVQLGRPRLSAATGDGRVPLHHPAAIWRAHAPARSKLTIPQALGRDDVDPPARRPLPPLPTVPSELFAAQPKSRTKRPQNGQLTSRRGVSWRDPLQGADGQPLIKSLTVGIGSGPRGRADQARRHRPPPSWHRRSVPPRPLPARPAPHQSLATFSVLPNTES